MEPMNRGTRMRRYARVAVRSVYGLFFLLTGIWILLTLSTGLTSPPPQPTPAATAFMEALSATGFIDPLLAVSFILGGGSLLVDRTTPLGLVILAPAVTVILLFHLVASGGRRRRCRWHLLGTGLVLSAPPGVPLDCVWATPPEAREMTASHP
jgi:hypothetical protein